jgi:hypothetical protein
MAKRPKWWGPPSPHDEQIGNEPVFIDMSWRQLWKVYGSVFRTHDRAALADALCTYWATAPAAPAAVEERPVATLDGWRRRPETQTTPPPPPPPPAHVLVALSARTAVDLFFQARAYAAGSIVLMSAINIPDLGVIVRHHGLIPVPVDVDVATVAPRLDLLADGLQDGRVVAVLVAHLWGRRIDMQPIIDLCRRASADVPLSSSSPSSSSSSSLSTSSLSTSTSSSSSPRRHIDVIEDCAECFVGTQYRGAAGSDLVFHSFGSIKTNTAFGGALASVRCARTHAAMVAIQVGVITFAFDEHINCLCCQTLTRHCFVFIYVYCRTHTWRRRAQNTWASAPATPS